MTAADHQRAADLVAALVDLSDAELTETVCVFAGVRDVLTLEGRRRQARLHGVIAAHAAAEQRRRRAEVKQLEAAWRADEPTEVWWGSDAIS